MQSTEYTDSESTVIFKGGRFKALDLCGESLVVVRVILADIGCWCLRAGPAARLGDPLAT
jgi:hypothetical protein